MATRPIYPSVLSQLEAWDALVNNVISILQGPLPLAEFTGLGTLPTASQYEGCEIMYRPNSGSAYRHAYSNGSIWLYTNGENQITS